MTKEQKAALDRLFKWADEEEDLTPGQWRFLKQLRSRPPEEDLTPAEAYRLKRINDSWM